jgi:hypothetical protein
LATDADFVLDGLLSVPDGTFSQNCHYRSPLSAHPWSAVRPLTVV